MQKRISEEVTNKVIARIQNSERITETTKFYTNHVERTITIDNKVVLLDEIFRVGSPSENYLLYLDGLNSGKLVPKDLIADHLIKKMEELVDKSLETL